MTKLIWIGVLCCIGALALNLFPALTYELGMDRGGAWSFFGFGLFPHPHRHGCAEERPLRSFAVELIEPARRLTVMQAADYSSRRLKAPAARKRKLW